MIRIRPILRRRIASVEPDRLHTRHSCLCLSDQAAVSGVEEREDGRDAEIVLRDGLHQEITLLVH